MRSFRSILPAFAAWSSLAVGDIAMGADYPATCVTQDYVICEGPLPFSVVANSTIRIGANNNNGSPSGRNAVLVFPLPVLGPGEQFVTATLTFNVAGKSGSPTFNADLWGIGFQPNTSPLLEYFEANTGDSADTKLQDNVIVPSFTSGNVTLTNHPGIAAYRKRFTLRIQTTRAARTSSCDSTPMVMQGPTSRLEPFRG